MTSYVNFYVEKTHLLRPPLGDVRNQPIKRLMAALIYIYYIIYYIYYIYYIYIYYIYIIYIICIIYYIYNIYPRIQPLLFKRGFPNDYY